MRGRLPVVLANTSTCWLGPRSQDGCVNTRGHPVDANRPCNVLAGTDRRRPNTRQYGQYWSSGYGTSFLTWGTVAERLESRTVSREDRATAAV